MGNNSARKAPFDPAINKSVPEKTYTEDQVVDAVLSMIGKQRFANWYNDGGNFDKWIRGESYAPTDENIRDNIKSLLGL